MRQLKILILLLLPFYGFCQGELLSDYSKAEILLQTNHIDFEKLKNNVKQVIIGNLQPDTKRTMTREKDGKVNVDIQLNNEKH
jgi:hypothetical protein